MPAHQFTADDFARVLQTMLPRGRAWPREPGTTQAKVIKGLAAAFSRVTGRAVDLLIDANPATTYELLGEWEQSLGLPNACTGELAGTIEGRQQQVVAKLIETGGQSIGYYMAIAAALGYEIEIREFAPYSFRSSFAEPWRGEDWAFAWQITTAATSVETFTFASTFADAFAYWGDRTLECVFNRIKPAHTVLIFNYE